MHFRRHRRRTETAGGPLSMIERFDSLSRLTVGLAAVGLASCLTSNPAYAGGKYQLGSGYDVGPFNFSGYMNFVVALPDQGPKSATLEDLSLFAAGHISKLINPFVEAELTHLVVADTDHSGENNTGAELVLERYYNDSYLSDSVILRLGKMLAPVGEWNLNHAAPLVLATSRPAVTFRNFAAYIQGVSLLYSDPEGGAPDMQVYWQPDWEETEKPRGVVFEQHKMAEGIHVSVPILQFDKVGFSFQRVVDFHGVTQSLVGGDFRYTLQNVTLQGEATYSSLSGGDMTRLRDDESGGYLSATYAFNPRWSAYSWYEAFMDRTQTSAAQDALVGVAYHPVDVMVVKLEYLQNFGGTPVNPTGLFASWSVLF